MENSTILYNAITKDGSARILYLDSTEMTKKAASIHSLSITATAVLGRSLTISSMMGYMLKNNETLTFKIQGDGAIGGVVCVADSDGNVKGYVAHPSVELAKNSKGKIDVGGAIGRGNLYIIKDLGMNEPYVGISPLVSGEIAEDVTEYFAKSEQTPTICSLGVKVDELGSCVASGGFILQLLPFSDDAIIPLLERNMAQLAPISKMIHDGLTVSEILDKILKDIPYDLFDPICVDYKCNCSREKYKSALVSLGVKELQALIDEEEPVETSCHFCGKKHIFETKEMIELLKNAM